MDTETRASVLVVDDEPGICELLETLLAGQGYRVQTCCSATEGLKFVDKASFDAVITDLKMPGIDGLTFIRQLKARKPDVAAIMITGYATVETAVEALRHGADDYVTKPFNVEELRKVVSRALDARRLAREHEQLVGRLEAIRGELRLARRGARPALEPSQTPEERRIERICRINTALSTLTSTDELCHTALRLICEELKVISATLMTVSEDRRSLIVRAALKQAGPAPAGVGQPITYGVAGWVAQHKEPLLIQDIRRTPLFQDEPREHYPNGSLLSVPLLHEGTLYGVLNLMEKKDDAVFGNEELHLVTPAAAQIAASLRTCESIAALREQAVNALRRMAELVESRASFIAGHSRRVADYAEQIARALDVDGTMIERLRLASEVHDIGYACLSDQLLGKPGRFTRSERDRMQMHATQGGEILEFLGFVDDERTAVRHHHERFNGTGYPDRLRGESIPLLSRILAVADSFDAMTSPRPHRREMTREAAIGELRRNSGTQFDARCVEALEQALSAASATTAEQLNQR